MISGGAAKVKVTGPELHESKPQQATLQQGFYSQQRFFQFQAVHKALIPVFLFYLH
jgi:hypothetical protein